MTIDDIYRELFSELIKSKMNIFGILAFKKALSVGDLVINDDGNVTSFSSNPISILRRLILKYEEIAGKPTTVFSKRVIYGIMEKYPELKLPEEFNPE